MKVQFEHNLMSSFYLWFDSILCSEGEAVITGTTQRFYYGDGIDTPSDMNAFYSSANQFCVDSPLAPSGVLIDGSEFQQSTTGTKILIDNNKGRILLDKSLGTDISVSGAFVQKEVNLYTTNETEEEILLKQEFYIDSGETYSESSDQLASAKYYLPCVFLSNNISENKGFALGGTRDTSTMIRATILATSNYQLDGILSLFRDKSERCVGIISAENYPYGEYWHLRDYPYTYTGYLGENKIDDTFIKTVRAYKLTEKGQEMLGKVSKGIYIGYLDFNLSTIRDL